MTIKAFNLKIPGSIRFWALLALALLAMSLFAELAEELEETHTFDFATYDFLIQFKADRLTQTAIDITSLGSVAVLTLFTLVLFIFLFGVNDRIGLFHLTVAMGGAALWPNLLKHIFVRERPDIALHLVKAGDFSFPSGHSFGAAAAYFTFAFFASRHFTKLSLEIISYTVACGVIVLVGLSRIYLGVHYASDVVAGVCAGVAWSCIVSGAFFHAYKVEKTHG